MNAPLKRTVFDFSQAKAGTAWDVIDDRIMGGESQGSAMITADKVLRFAGTVSLENNGGFASIRSTSRAFDLSQGEQVVVRVKGDGKTYKLGMRIDLFYDGVTYLAEFQTIAGEWQELSFPFAIFRPYHHGQQLANAAPFDPSGVKSFVFLIGGRQEGSFQLDVDWIKIA